jgi:UDP-glucose 4-epimerase
MAISTVLVTGAAGGIGWTVTRMLRDRGVRVIAWDDMTTGLKRGDDPGITWEFVDVADPAVPQRLSAHPIDAVVHCAARLADRSMQEPSADVRTNAFGSMQIFEWCARAQVQRVLFLSSSAVYGDPPAEPITERTPLQPNTIYAVCKLACENFLRILEKGYGLQWTVLRLFPTYGPSHKPSKTQGILNVMLTQLQAGNEVVVKGSLERVRDLVYVEDTARAIVESLFSDAAKSKIFNVGSGQANTVREMIHYIAEALGRSPEQLQIKELEGTPGDPLYNVADISALKQAIGYTPKFDLRTGIQRLVESRRAN